MSLHGEVIVILKRQHVAVRSRAHERQQVDNPNSEPLGALCQLAVRTIQIDLVVAQVQMTDLLLTLPLHRLGVARNEQCDKWGADRFSGRASLIQIVRRQRIAELNPVPGRQVAQDPHLPLE